MSVVVMGAGLAGLAAALLLGRHGFSVVVLERDGAVPPQNADCVFQWRRPGTPQARLHHSFAARTHAELAVHAADVLDRLRERGAVERDLAGVLTDRQASDDELRATCARRAVIEAALRTCVEATPAVSIRSGQPATGVVVEDGRVTGVRCDGTTISSSVVIDAAGRRSPVRQWLESCGIASSPRVRSSCGIAYASRYFRLRDGVELPAIRGPVVEGASLGFMGYAIGPADRGHYSVVFAFPSNDSDMRALLRPKAWDAVAAGVERTAVFVDSDVGTPIMEPAPMFGLDNTIWRWHDGHAPIVRGLVAVGDAWSTTDPLFGWGVSFALAHGFGIARSIVRHGADVDSAIEAFLRTYIDEVEQRFNMSCEDGRARLSQWQETRWNRPPGEVEREALAFALMRGAREDAMLRRALLRRTSLLSLPDDLWDDAELMSRLRRVLVAHPYDATKAMPGPSRADVLAIIDR